MKLLLFDIDGTLLRTAGAGRESTRRAMLEIYGSAEGVETHAFSGKTDWRTLVELLGETHTHDEIAARLHHYNEAMGRHIGDIIGGYAVSACPFALETVAALRKEDRFALGILTGNVSHAANAKLRAAGFDPSWFPIGAYGHEAYSRNDLPVLAIQRAAAHYQRPFTPHETIIIGDTVMDIECARAVGAQAVAVCTGFESREILSAAEPDALLDDLTTLLNWIG